MPGPVSAERHADRERYSQFKWPELSKSPELSTHMKDIFSSWNSKVRASILSPFQNKAQIGLD